MIISEIRSLMGGNYEVMFRDRSGHRRMHAVHISDVRYKPAGGIYLIGGGEDIPLELVTSINNLK